jgi:hypothetical protein
MSNSQQREQPLYRTLQLNGHTVKLTQVVLGQRIQTFHMTQEEFDQIDVDVRKSIMSVSDVEPEAFEPAPAPTADAAGNARRQKEWEAAKAAHDRKIAAQPKLKNVTMPLAIRQTLKATVDGAEVRIFHTVRGPMIGAIAWEDTDRAGLYSPCMLDCNIRPGSVHYIPVAFAGYMFTVYKKACIGESVPQESEIFGYPEFITQNKQGDYLFISRSALNHYDADIPASSQVVSADMSVRDAGFGIVQSTDVRERIPIAHAQARKNTLEALQAPEAPAPPSIVP